MELRIVTTKVWNKEDVSRLEYLFEYEDDKAYQNCQPIFQEIERNEKKDQMIKVFVHPSSFRYILHANF